MKLKLAFLIPQNENAQSPICAEVLVVFSLSKVAS